MRPATADHSEPAYQRLASLLEQMIRSRSMRPGDRLPSVRHFSGQQRVSVPTALQAFATLETRGLIEARPKSGFYVRAVLADSVRVPSVPSASPRVTDFAGLDPIEAILADHSVSPMVPLGAAIPGDGLLPGVRLARTMAAVARRLGPAGGAYDMAPGSEILRRELARRSLDWGCSLQPADFIVTVGCTEAVSLALRATCEPGDTVLVESPTYYGLAMQLRDLKLKALPVPVDPATGIDLAALERALRRNRVAAAVLIPNFHNPVGFAMPDDHKRHLLQLLAKCEIPLIEDDIYGDLQHAGPRPRCAKAFDRDGNVLLCGSFSKTLAPGYRIGYIAAGRRHKRVLALKRSSSIASATLPTLAAAEFLRNGGYDRHLRTMRRVCKEQVARMKEAVVASFPPGIGLSRPQGGFVLWCELPAKVDSLVLFKQAREAGISIIPGPLFSSDGGFSNFIRLNCGHPWSPQIERSVAVLGQMIKRMV